MMIEFLDPLFVPDLDPILFVFLREIDDLLTPRNPLWKNLVILGSAPTSTGSSLALANFWIIFLCFPRVRAEIRCHASFEEMFLQIFRPSDLLLVVELHVSFVHLEGVFFGRAKEVFQLLPVLPILFVLELDLLDLGRGEHFVRGWEADFSESSLAAY